MQNTSNLWKQIAREDYTVEYKADIAGVEYGWGELMEFSTETPLFGDFSIGNTTSAQLSFVILPKGEIPRMAEIKCYKRLVYGAAASEWLPHGVYYIDTRKKSYDGRLEIQAFDAMLKANAAWLVHTDILEWPVRMEAAARDIAKHMGVELDSRTVFRTGPDYVVDYPNDYQMSEVLRFIAAAHGGNWVMTYEGKLRLINLLDTPAETYHLVDSSDGAALLFGNVRVLI